MSTEHAAQSCADAETLTALARGELGEAERAALLDHALGCQTCSDLIALSAELVDWSDHAFADTPREHNAEIVPLRASKSKARIWAGWAMAASVLLMVAAGSVFLPRQTPDRTLRGNAVAALLPVDQAVLAAAPEQLRWDCPSAQAVRVELAGADGEPLWRTDVEHCEVRIPPTVSKALVAGTYLWWVTDRQGQRIAGPFTFDLVAD